MPPHTTDNNNPSAAAAQPPSAAPLDVELHCGVPLASSPNADNSASPDTTPTTTTNIKLCRGSITCKRHSMAAKRAVPGRSAPYDQLVAAHMEERRRRLKAEEGEEEERRQ